MTVKIEDTFSGILRIHREYAKTLNEILPGDLNLLSSDKVEIINKLREERDKKIHVIEYLRDRKLRALSKAAKRSSVRLKLRNSVADRIA